MIPATFESEGSYEAVIYCSDCGAEISRETVVVAKTADFRELSTAVDEVIKDITQTKISEDGTDVGIDEVWVKQADADIMLNTLASAMKITSDLNVSQEEVDQVRNQLLEAREAFDSAKSYGYAEQSGEINPQSDTSALSTAVSDIMAMQVGIRISVDGTDVEPEASWVTSTVSERLMQKLNEAIAMLGDNSVLQEEVDRMKSELSSESELYRNAIRKGSKKPQQKIIEVVKKDLTAATIKLEKSTYKYTGSAIIPKVTVILGNKQLREGTDYGVSCTANLNVGLATATVTGKGDYIGSLSESFTIDPVGTEITSIKKMKKGFKVKFKKQTNDISGYEIEYSKNKKFKKGTKSVLVKNTASTKKINKLKWNKKYYVRIRTYKDVGGVRYYSSWSKTKKVKTK